MAGWFAAKAVASSTRNVVFWAGNCRRQTTFAMIGETNHWSFRSILIRMVGLAEPSW